MFRLVFSIIAHFFTGLRLSFLLKKTLKNSTDTRMRYETVRHTTIKLIEKLRVKVKVSGLENLPREGGYFLMPNHQGRFDGLPVVQTHEEPMTFIVDKNRSDISYESIYMDLIDALRIDRTNPRQAMKVFRNAAERVKEGQHICVFPEGGHMGNRNSLQEFRTGAFHFVKRQGLTIVPVVLFDSWKVFNYESIRDALKRVTCQIHYLKPIKAEEYSNLSKKEIAELLKSRIREKIEELEKELSLSDTGRKDPALNLS